jgi:predicted DNA repair protein MutK
MDDFGLKLIQMSKGHKTLLNYSGVALVNALPIVIKVLSVVGTVALLLVSGGIFIHNVDALHHLLETLPGISRDLIFGLIVGLITLLVVRLCKLILKPFLKPA